MRIAYITYEFPPDTGKGGIGTYCNQVSEMMAKAGWDVHVFAGSSFRQSNENTNGVTIHRIKSSDPHTFTKAVVRVFTAEHTLMPFDLIEAPEIHSNYKEIVNLFPELPLIIRLHAPNQLVERLKKKYIPLSRKIRFVLGSFVRLRPNLGYWKAYDKYVDTDYINIGSKHSISAPSQSMKDWAITNWHIPEKKITVIPNPFEAPTQLVNLAINEKEVSIILFYGRLNVLKGLYNASIAMKEILKKNQSVKFRLIGDDQTGPYGYGSMKEWIRNELKIVNSRVEFLDGISYEQLADSIADADIVLIPSLFESFSYTCAEAMAAGKVVIGAKGTGMENMIQNNVTGILVDPNKMTEIRAAINLIVRNKDLKLKIRNNARESIIHKFSAETLLPLYKQYYSNLLADQ